MMKTKLQSITANLMVEDVDATADYYREVLGFGIEMSVPRDDGKLQWAMLTKDGVALMCQEKGNLIGEVPQLENSQIGGSMTLFIQMEGLESYYDEVKSKANIVKEPMVTFYGMKEFTIQDVNGYILTFAEPQEESNQ